MRVLQIAKMAGGIGRHVSEIARRSKNDFYFLDYDHAINIPLLRAFTFLFLGLPIGIFRTIKEKIDVIHAHYLIPAGLLGVLIGKLTRRPVIVTVHGSDIMRLRRLGFLKRWVGNNSTVITTSEYLRKQLSLIGVRSKIIPNGVDHGAISRSRPKPLKKPAILFAGALIKNKVGILPEVICTGHNFYIAGDGPLREDLGGIKTGQLTPEELYSYMKGADIFISTSKWEGFGIAILEAMACGVPVIARPNSAQGELVEGRGLLADSSLEFKAAIAKYLSDRKLRARAVREGIKFAKNFTWEKTANELDRAYKLSKGG